MRVRCRSLEVTRPATLCPVLPQLCLCFLGSRFSNASRGYLSAVTFWFWSTALCARRRDRICMARTPTMLCRAALNRIRTAPNAVRPLSAGAHVVTSRVTRVVLANEHGFDRTRFCPGPCLTHNFNGERASAALADCEIQERNCRAASCITQMLTPPLLDGATGDTNVLSARFVVRDDVGLKHLAIHVDNSTGIFAI